MAQNAPVTQYREEFIAGFEQSVNYLKATVTSEAVIKGNTATFLVADTNNAEMVTRGLNGRIPARNDNLTQYACTLNEWHDKVERTNYNLFSSQGDGRRIMQAGTIKVANRKIDQDILTALAAGTVTAGAATTASLAWVMKIQAILGLAEVAVEDEDNMFAVCSPAVRAYLMQTKEFTSADYVEVKPFEGPAVKMKRWAGFNWIFHPRLSGVGTAAEKCFFYHRDAIGHAVDKAGMDIAAGYNEEDKYSWASTSIHMGSKLLQNSGLVVATHDGSAYVGS